MGANMIPFNLKVKGRAIIPAPNMLFTTLKKELIRPALGPEGT
jgi:hypothetical protein